jgi:CubicO group peptidase (beta-lactamase class C family)
MDPSLPALDDARLDAAFDLVRRQTDERATYAALAVGRPGRLVRSAAFLRGKETPPRRTAIASITKPITATAIMRLVEAGRLVLLEPLTTYLPEFRPTVRGEAAGPIEPLTAWHILTHTSGLPDASDEFLLSAPPEPAAQFERLCRTELLFRPGTEYSYASDSWYVLSTLIERITGEPYPEYLRSHIFEPLGMAATSFNPTKPGPEPLPLQGSFGPDGVPFDVKVAYFIALAMPGGGLWSTTEDVATFGRAMLNGGTLDGVRVLGRSFVDLMTRPHTNDVRERGTGRDPGYGLGWGLPWLGRASPSGALSFGHTGATGSTLIVDPANDLVVVYLRNDWSAPMTLTDEAVQAVYGALD